MKVDVLKVIAGATSGHCDPAEMVAVHDAVLSLIAAAQPFASVNSSDEPVVIHVRSDAIRRLRSALYVCEGQDHER